MSKPGKVRPGSVKSKNRDHWPDLDLMRGGQEDSEKAIVQAKSSEHLGDAKNEKLFKPESEPVQKLFTNDDLVRGKIVSFSFGLTLALIVLGITGITVLSLLGMPTDPIIKFLESLLLQLMAIITFAAGYYFGKQARKS